MSRTSVVDTIQAYVEGDELVYEWSGTDVEERHEDWALDDAQTFDSVVPA